MKILAITDLYPPHHQGGYELRSKDIFDGLRRKGHEVYINSSLCPDRRCQMHTDEPFVSRVLHHKSETTSILKRIILDSIDLRFIDWQIQTIKPDLIYLSHLGDLASPIFFYLAVLEVPIIIDDGGLGVVFLNRIFKNGLYFYKNPEDPVIRTWMKSFLNSAIYFFSNGRIPKEIKWPEKYMVIFNNSRAFENAKEKGILVKNTKVIFSGVDTSIFTYTPRLECNKPIRIIVPGRIESQKGTKDALHLLEKLQANKIDAQLTLLGSVGSPVYFDEIIHEVAEKSLQDIVQVSPMVTHRELSELYRESDICFFPSYHKTGLSRVPLEAMASGCVIISYGNEGSSHIIQNGVTGHIVPEGDIDAVASLIIKITSTPGALRQITSKARRVIDQEYSMKVYLDRIEDCVTSIGSIQ